MPSPENSPALLGRGSARWAQFSKHSEAPFDSQVTILPLLYNRGGGVALRSGRFPAMSFIVIVYLETPVSPFSSLLPSTSY